MGTKAPNRYGPDLNPVPTPGPPPPKKYPGQVTINRGTTMLTGHEAQGSHQIAIGTKVVRKIDGPSPEIVPLQIISNDGLPAFLSRDVYVITFDDGSTLTLSGETVAIQGKVPSGI